MAQLWFAVPTYALPCIASIFSFFFFSCLFFYLIFVHGNREIRRLTQISERREVCLLEVSLRGLGAHRVLSSSLLSFAISTYALSCADSIFSDLLLRSITSR